MIGVYKSDSYTENYLSIIDHDDEEVVLLLPKEILCSPSECEKNYDWITEEKLLDTFFVSLRNSKEYTREQIRQIKDNVLQTLNVESDVSISEERVERICNLFDSISKENDQIQQIVQYAMDDATLKEALIKEIAENHFDLIGSKLPEYDSVQQEISKLNNFKAKLEDEIRDIEDSRNEDELPADYAEKLEELKNENDENNNKIKELEQIINDYKQKEQDLKNIEEIKNDIIRLSKERDDYTDEYKKAKEKYNQQIIDNNELKKQFEKTLESFTTEELSPRFLDRSWVIMLTLFRTTKNYNKDYYTPDFVLKFYSDTHNEEYVVFDSKFSSRDNIKKYSLDEVILKYSREFASTAKVSYPKMVWILQGRVKSSENPIWKYHNSRLASRYLPATSYGIASVNTIVDIKQRLWNEIKRCISLL
ncbi:hypothetical protein [Ruminococcus sp. JE7B6]|uniref:hypothetical protein n=1 Tax=Ruminococcus sp. JE7B6 TaxID=3233380 RepID=UPI00389A3E88